ncbi:MAG: porin family protein [Prevotella sp.]|nr:porin family protein [Prevotella sp.]
MKTKIFAAILGILLLNSVSVEAQDNLPVKRFEFEVKMEPNYPMDSYKSSSRNIGGSWGLEARWNMNTPFDIGAEIYWGFADRDYLGENFSYRILSISTFVDYNFRRGQNVSPFVGIGLGDADCCVLEHKELGGSSDDGTTIVFTPRVGVELWRHLRLTLDARIARKGYNTIGLSVGYAFGGGLKSKKQ